MKRKLLLTAIITTILMVCLAVSSYATYIIQDEDGNELLRYELESNVVTGETGVGFAKYDSEGDALIWYITATETVDSNTVKTVASIKTKAATTISSSGVLTLNKDIVPNAKVISINYDIGGFTTIGAHMFSSSKYGICSVMYAYIPSYVTVFGERLFREATSLILLDIPYDSQLTDMGVFPVWRTRSLRALFIPKGVTTLNNEKVSNDGTNNSGILAYFESCNSLKKVVFHPDNVITEMTNAPFYGAPVEEIRFSNNLKFLGDRSFRGCSKLKRIYFGDSFEGFYSVYMFWGCSSLENLYIPGTITQNTTGRTYAWSQIFDSNCSSSFKIHFTGTEAQFISFYDTLISAGNNPQVKNMVTDGVINTERVVFTTDCDAFYYGNHITEDDNNCTTELACERCKTVFEEAYDSHDNQLIIEYANGFLNSGYKKDGCARCSVYTELVLDPLFVSRGYSAEEGEGGGIVIGFGVDHDAIDTYESLTGGKIAYGLFAVGYDKLAGNDILDAETAEPYDGVVKAEVTNEKFVSLGLKVVGLDTADSKKTKLTLGVYAIETQGETKKIHYLQDGTPAEGEKYSYVTYNDFVVTE